MLSVDVNFSQLNIAMKDIEKYRSILTDSRWIYSRISSILRAAFKKEFDSKGSYHGQGWPKLATSTLIAKKYEGFHQGILRRTDKYYKALTDKGKNPDRRQKITAKGLRFELRPESFRDDFGLVYPELHETGTDEIPARPIFSTLRESDKFRRRLVEVLLRDLEKKLAEAV